MSAPGKSAPAKSERVLIVDDEPGILRAAERILSPAYQVMTASRPSEAMDLVAACEPDLVICDIRMPEMDGFALVKLIRARRPEIDAIFMTGSHTEPDAHLVRAIRSDAFYFIQKPFDRLVLTTLVERCLELRRLRSAQRNHTARLERELAEAALFQRTMLGPESGPPAWPAILRPLPGLHRARGRPLRLRRDR
jgi:DNA-binding NtrC family response regulator